MAHIYDDQKRLIELQAKNGRLSLKAPQRQVEELMEAEADRLEKSAAVVSDRGLWSAYLAKAKEIRESIPVTLEKVAGTAAEQTSLRKVVTAAADREHNVNARLDMLEKSLAADPLRRPIGMPAPAVAAPSAPAPHAGPSNGPVLPSKPSSQMTNEEKSAYFARLARAASTNDEFRMWDAESRKCAEAARQEMG